MMSCRRRLLQSHGNEEKFLKRWWSADDDLVGRVWCDRKGSGINWTAKGNIKKENGLYITDGDEGYFIFNDYNRILDLGHHFKVVFEGEIKPTQFKELKIKITEIINKDEDSVIIYKMPPTYKPEKTIIGIEKSPIKNIL